MDTYMRGQFTISTDPARLDLDAIHAFLSRTYWAEHIPKSTVARALANSFCFGVYDGTRQIGLTRVITDRATYAYLADVYILEEYRGQGLANGLYAQFDFASPATLAGYMVRRVFAGYPPLTPDEA